MDGRDALIAGLVVTAWGVNFAVMKAGLAELSPAVLGLLRFSLLLPAVCLLPRPAVRWYWLALYGLCISFGQFGMMFTALSWGMPSGLAALLLQSQVFFTVILAVVWLREPVAGHHLPAMLLAAAGLLLAGIGQYRGVVPLAALWAVLAAAMSWALGNLTVKFIGRVNPLSLVAWGNISSWAAFLLLSLWLYGAGEVGRQIADLSAGGWLAAAFLAYVSGLFGYGGWGRLLARYPASLVTPLALLVPVIALLVSALVLGERLNGWQWGGVAVVMAALLVQVSGGRLRVRGREK
ncbi:EamA family transporter [Neisseria leonii]|uniref:EamA family transporter n=1 Tax=Neisseria leonii TaxID=2995413 RepID=UPI00237AD05A|nr:EamA family transporter [Neisseria sp. 3986]MDD9326307.1 EamA family transporter [Neisseria sp. 3986]